MYGVDKLCEMNISNTNEYESVPAKNQGTIRLLLVLY